MNRYVQVLSLISSGFIWFTLVAQPSSAVADDPSNFLSVASPFLQTYCSDCHGGGAAEGGVALHDLKEVTPGNAEIWKRVWEQIALDEMPPRDVDERPSAMRRLKLSNLITEELQRAMKDRGGFQAHRLPGKGNHIDHDLLFGKVPTGLEPPSTPARIWRVHPQEHLVRLNALITDEPDFNPQRPGLRTRGDHIPPNQDGEVKVYYGLDRVIGWVGGTAAYAAAITGFPPMLSSVDQHGLRSYPVQNSVNGADATQIARNAENILRFMAFGPDAKPYQFADNVREIPKKYKHESLRGLAESLFYSKETKRPLTPLYDLMQEEGVSETGLRQTIEYLFESMTGRPPTESETDSYFNLAQETIADLGKEDGVILGLVPIFLDREALFRMEMVEQGSADEFGRVMLQDWELALAINAAFSYLPPDEKLKSALTNGRLKTKDDVRREVRRILEDPSIRKPRILQFFREYFDYDRAGSICKDTKAMVAAGAVPKNYYRTQFGMTAHTDRLVELFLAEDKEVLKELLTTDRAVVNPKTDANYFGEFTGRRKQTPKREAKPDSKKKKKRNASSPLVGVAEFPEGTPIDVRIAPVVKRASPRRVLTTLPSDQRMGILSHPSWLVSHSDAMDNHAIHRGKWIRERLLGDAVPDVPITVDAMLPDEPRTTLRHRMRVTRDDNCWRCHRKMDPLGLPFEMFNHVGLYRTDELGKPVDASGEIIDSGDKSLDGPVENALDLIEKLAASERVEQVFVRHVFRFWMGRNETIQDALVLQAAHRAYRDSGGSMKELLVSLLTSDAFLYRKRVETDSAE